MGLNIKNSEVEDRIRELAKLNGTSLTEAVDRAVSDALLDAHARSPEYRARVRNLLDELRAMDPLPAHVSSDHRDMYDEDGLPIW